MPAVSLGDVLECLELPSRHLCSMASVILVLDPKVKMDLRHTELAPIYRTHPISITSFSALIISSRGTSRSMRWICNTSMYVPSRRMLACTASNMCFRDNPERLTSRPSLTVAANTLSWGWSGSLVANRHLVIITTPSLGILYFNRAFPIIISDTPFEYKSDFARQLPMTTIVIMSRALPYPRC